MKKVLIGMSGGVDSSVAAYLLKEEGYEVVGCTMQLLDNDASINAINDAKEVCESLNIKHLVLDLRKEFKEEVINNLIDNYYKGLTPNPCVICNKYFKFGRFYSYAKELGIDYISTGHYASISNGVLKRASNIDKDQSYFLWNINKDVLEHILFPLKDYSDKEKVREIAKKANLRVFKKKDSQEVCFVPNDDYKSFLEANLEKLPDSGNIVLKDKTVLGKHKGLCFYTIGQRKGLNISYEKPLYVIKLDTLNNELVVGDNEDLFENDLIATNINLFVKDLPQEVYAKIRSRGTLSKALIEKIDANTLKVHFIDKQRAITPGQSVVFYNDNDECLGGGFIKVI